tara:strand:+ start:40 stop:741 length:702 start_codon:yes stop_codon:yes gene_type:complete
MNNYIYVIPARAGSKRIPNKNILSFNSKPLLSHSIDFAKKVSKEDNIYVLTDSEVAKSIALEENVNVYMRPHIYSRDNTSMIDTIFNFINSKDIDTSYHIVLLQPTCPFRSISFFNKLKKLYESSIDSSSALSIIKCSFFHPSKIGQLTSTNNFEFLNVIRQDNIDNSNKQSFYVISGTYYITSINNLVLNKSFTGDNPVALEEDVSRFCNIDIPLDFELAKLIGKSQKCVVL